MQNLVPSAPLIRASVGLVAAHQHESLIDLLCELHGFYNEGAKPARAEVKEHLLHNLLAPGSPQRLMVVCAQDGAVAGLAALTLVFSLVEFTPGKRRQCQLKELYVRSSQRGKGLGEMLMSGVARFALEHGCARLDWPVKATNARGIAFYESLGAELVADRLSYRLGEAQLRQLALGPVAPPARG